MFAFLIGDNHHFVAKRFSDKEKATTWLHNEKRIYEKTGKQPLDIGIVTDQQWKQKVGEPLSSQFELIHYNDETKVAIRQNACVL